MLKVYLSVIHALLTLTDTHRYHTQLSTVTSDIDMISVVFIRDKSLKLHASMSIHTTGISLVLSSSQSMVQKLQMARVISTSVRVSPVALWFGSEMDPYRRDLTNILPSYLVSDSFRPVLGARAGHARLQTTTSAYHGSGILRKPSERDVSGCHPDFQCFILLSFYMV